MRPTWRGALPAGCGHLDHTNTGGRRTCAGELRPLTALLRVEPLVFPTLFPDQGAIALPVAKITGLAALIVFGINLFTGPGV